MICSKCGKEINNNAKFCVFCGTKTSAKSETPVTEPVKQPANDVQTPPLIAVDENVNLDEIMSKIDTLTVDSDGDVVTVPFTANNGNLFTTPVANQSNVKPEPMPNANKVVAKDEKSNDKSKLYLIIAIIIIAVVAIIGVATISSFLFSSDTTGPIEPFETVTRESGENRYELLEEPLPEPSINTTHYNYDNDDGNRVIPSLESEPNRGQDITPTYRGETTTQATTTRPTTRPSERPTEKPTERPTEETYTFLPPEHTTTDMQYPPNEP